MTPQRGFDPRANDSLIQRESLEPTPQGGNRYHLLVAGRDSGEPPAENRESCLLLALWLALSFWTPEAEALRPWNPRDAGGGLDGKGRG